LILEVVQLGVLLPENDAQTGISGGFFPQGDEFSCSIGAVNFVPNKMTSKRSGKSLYHGVSYLLLYFIFSQSSRWTGRGLRNQFHRQVLVN